MKLTIITKDHVLISIGWSLLDLEHLNIESCPRRVNRWAKSLIYPLQSWHLLYDWLLLDMLCCDWLYQTVGINPCLSLSTCILSLVLPHSHPEYLSVRFPHCPWPDISSQHRTRSQYYLISHRLITNILHTERYQRRFRKQKCPPSDSLWGKYGSLIGCRPSSQSREHYCKFVNIDQATLSDWCSIFYLVTWPWFWA